MNHVLDNPIYNALISGHKDFAKGGEKVKYYMEDIASFAGLKTYSAANFEELYQISLPESLFVVFSVIPLQIPKNWNVVNTIEMYQMVYPGKVIPQGEDIAHRRLAENNVAEMMDLVNLTKPGPFLERTIALGNYVGIFDEDKLIAMAGHRFNPTPYREISAVCTHPNHLGKGHSFALLNEQLKRILTDGEIPFLHVKQDNLGAIKLYEKLGFEIRTQMTAYVIVKA